MVLLSCPTTSVSVSQNPELEDYNPNLPLGLISQVAEELWEVKGRKIRNLTKEDIGIAEYKKRLVQNSMCPTPLS